MRTDSGNIHYWVSEHADADKMTIFFLHGLTADHNLFIKQIDYFKQQYNIIAWDAPAHGKSRPYNGFTFEKAAFAVKEILKENKIEKAIFVGQSLGGYIAQSVIKRFPEIVQGFISIDSTPFGKRYYSKSDIWWLRQIEWMSKIFPEKSLKKAIAKQNSLTENAYQNMLEMLRGYEKNELCHLMSIGYAGFLEDNCDLEIHCPTLLIVGEKDTTGKVKQYNKAWSKDINVPITWVPNAAHNSNDDQPELVNKYIADFLNNIFQNN